MLGPLGQIVVRCFIIDRVDKDADLGLVQEEMRQVMHCIVTCCIPNVKLEAMSLPIRIGHVLHLGEVLDHVGRVDVLAALRRVLHKRVDDRRFAYTGVAHDYDLGALHHV